MSVGVGRTRGPHRRIEIDRSISLVCTAPHHTNGHRKCASAPDEGVYCDDEGEDGQGKLDSRTRESEEDPHIPNPGHDCFRLRRFLLANISGS